MAKVGFKLTKVRTFRDDFARAQVKHAGEAANQPRLKKAVEKPEAVKVAPVRAELAKPTRPIEVTGARVQKATPLSTPTIPKPNLASIDVSGVRKEGRRSLLDSGGKNLNVLEAESEAGEGSIITDQKRERFRLLPAMAEAFQGWLQDTQETVVEMASPDDDQPKIKAAAKRKEVIQKAAKASARAPKDDYRLVAERLAKTGRRPITSQSALSIKKRAATPPPSWTHLKGEETKPETFDKEAEVTAKEAEALVTETERTVAEQVPESQVETVAKPAATTTRVTEVPVKPAEAPAAAVNTDTAKPAATPLPTAEPTPKPEPAAVLQSPPALSDDETPSGREAVSAEPTTPIPEPEPTAPPTAVVPEPVIPVAKPAKAPTVQPYQPPPQLASRQAVMVFSPWRVGTTAVAAILLGVSFSVWWFGGSDTPVLSGEESAEQLVRTEEQIPVALGTQASDLLNNLLAVRVKPTTVVAGLYPVGNIAGNTTPASAAQIMAVLEPQAPGSFVRAVSDINFGLYRDREPFIVMRVTGFDTAFGGMLEWEPNLSADLSPFFGAPVAGTFDPEARTATQIREPYFVDVVVGNLDARLLTDETQKERLIYAFLGRDIILMTTSRDALGALVNVVR